MPYSVLVIISAQKGKEERCKELLAWLSEQVKENEPQTSVYNYSTEDGDDGEGWDAHVYFEIADEDVLKERPKLEHHQEVRRILKEENLLRKPLKYIKLDDKGGWRR